MEVEGNIIGFAWFLVIFFGSWALFLAIIEFVFGTASFYAKKMWHNRNNETYYEYYKNKYYKHVNSKFWFWCFSKEQRTK